MYQLRQPPVFHTVVARSLCSSSLYRSCAARGCQRLRAHLSAAAMAGDVVDLRLDHEHHRVVPQPVLGPSRRNRLGMSATAMPWCASTPSGSSGPPRPRRCALDVEKCVPVGDVEARRQHDRVDGAFCAVDGDDAVRGHPRDSVGDHLGLRVRDGLIVVGGVEDSLAAGAVVRRQLGPQFGIPDVAPHVRSCTSIRGPHQLRSLGHATEPSSFQYVAVRTRQAQPRDELRRRGAPRREG